MRASYGIFALFITLTACSGKKRPFADGPIEGLGGSGGSSISTMERETDARSGSGVEPTATEERPPVDVISPPDDTNQSSGSLACEADAAACTVPDAGPLPAVCVPTGSRDCTSEADNDCDGQPDNVFDDVCLCLPGTVEPCNEHPGLDGRGPCRAGTRTCVAAEGNTSSDWGACEGAQGPEGADSCVPQDDGDCDGAANEGCDCVDGVAQPCGPPNDFGVCQRGTQTCINGSFGDCVGEVFGTARDCRSNADNDCDGLADNTIEGVCQCLIGSTQPCQQHPGQDGIGRCRAGSQKCLAGQNNSSSFFGACSGSVGPAQRDACTGVNDDDCDGFANDGCQCVSSRGNADCSSNPDASRCNGATGQCVACQSNADCSLVSGGRNVCQGGRCVSLLGAGATCAQNAECQSGRCDRWFQDLDGDGFGSIEARSCAGPGGVPAPPSPNHVAQSGDCCDLGGLSRAVALQIFPDQEALFQQPQAVCPSIDAYDYNCSGDIEYEFQEDTEAAAGGCAFAGCEGASVWALTQMGGQVPECGALGLLVGCAGVSPTCSGRPVGQVVNRCH